MASHSHHVPATAPRHSQPAAYGVQMPMAHSSAPAGTFAPGTKIQVGSHRVVIQKYLSEGGFAHVYLVKLSHPVNNTDLAVLKRVAVPDKDSLRGMRTEVETMKRLKGHRPIVTYIDSHASELRGGGYEVFLLMEYCNGGGLIDFMNTRLQHRLTEPEILNIFTDVAEGVACMHYLKPPLLHRDIKVENVLITTMGSARKFKLCDFGSAAPPRPAPTTVTECRLMDEDVQKHTTLQYRSPEMVDVYRKQPIDEKSDIWALGVLLYKLCYYTTPFEDQGQLAILNASLRFPSHPVFSDRLKKLIASMLRENQQSRPNIYQVLRESCSMQGREIPVEDIYAGGSRSEPGRAEKVSEPKPKAAAVVGASFAPSAPQQQVLPEIIPMRRGRPQATPQGASQPPKVDAAPPSKTPSKVTNGDPFAALDRTTASKPDADELSSRFPTLDEFSLLHDHGSKFSFEDATSPPAVPAKDLNQRVAERLADDAFAKPQPQIAAPSGSRQKPLATTIAKPMSTSPPTQQKASPPHTSPAAKPASAPLQPTEMSRAQAIISSTPELQAISAQSAKMYQPTPSRPMMVSQGTMTTPPPDQSRDYPPIYRFPPSDQSRASSLAMQPDMLPIPPRGDSAGPRSGPSSRISSYVQSAHSRHPSSSRPSLEGARPNLDVLEPMSKSRSSSGRPRPASTHLESSIDFLRERESTPKSHASAAQPLPSYGVEKKPSPRLEPEDEAALQSNVEFRRHIEDEPKKKDKPFKHGKRSSLTSLTGTKNILAGKFGDAFKRFEGNNAQNLNIPRTPSPLKDLERRDLTPIASSEATDGRSDDGRLPEETEEMTPEERRELERVRLAEEERRVAAAAAEYRNRVATSGLTPLPKSIGGVSRAVSIQNKVQSLLDETQRSSTTIQRTAEGYGRYTDAPKPPINRNSSDIHRTPIASGRLRPVSAVPVSGEDSSQPSSSAAAPFPSRPMPPGKPAPRPAPKPTHLNNITTSTRSGSPPKQAQAPLLTRPDESVVGLGMPEQLRLDMTSQEKEDYIRDFTKRYPSLSSLEMVERDIGNEGR